MARTRVLDVCGCERRYGRAGPAVYVHFKPKFCRTARAGRLDTFGKSGDRGGQRSDGQDSFPRDDGAETMMPFTICKGHAATLMRDNIDTDQIIRIERIAQLKRGEF